MLFSQANLPINKKKLSTNFNVFFKQALQSEKFPQKVVRNNSKTDMKIITSSSEQYIQLMSVCRNLRIYYHIWTH